MTDAPVNKTYSRSALANALDMSLKEVTEILLEAGWIKQEGDTWLLTNKGTFEGGEVKESKKYGNYLVWPAAVLDHAIFKIERDTSLSASDIGKAIALAPRLVNQVLQHCQWLKRSHRGWQVTRAGVAVGGIQHENPKTGVPWAMWPEDLLANDFFQAVCAKIVGDAAHQDNLSLNGVATDRPSAAAFLSWCYLSGVVASSQAKASVRPALSFDYYLPRVGLFVDIWDAKLPPQELASRLEKSKQCAALEIDYLMLESSGINEFEEELPRELLKRDYEI
jgi:hypothetical protein